MASRFILPFADVGDGITPSDGAKLFFFQSGTSTEKDTFSNSLGVTPNANPVIANAEGVFPDIFIDGSYKVRLTDKNNVQIWEADPVSAENGIRTFSDVSEMISAGVTVGDIVQTAGYNTSGDGGGNIYEIVAAGTGTDDGGSFIDLSTHQAKGLFPGGDVNVRQFGAFGDGANDDTAAILSAIAFGEYIKFPFGTYKTTAEIVVPEGVTFDLCGSTLQPTLVGTGGFDYAVRLSTRSWIINGTIDVKSSGTVGSGSGIHAPVTIGPLYSDGGTVASPSYFDSVNGWGLNNLVLKTDAVGKSSIAMFGGIHNGYIGNITIPTSSAQSGVHMDWGFLGDIDSNDVPGNRVLFDAGTAKTTHPHNITIENIKVEELTWSGAHLLRLSGCHNITVNNMSAEKIVGDGSSTAAVFHTAGDLGYEFADAETKPYAHRGIKISNILVEDSDISWSVFIDCFADNVEASVVSDGYVPILNPYAKTDIILEQFVAKSSKGPSANNGIRIQKTVGGTLRECTLSEFVSGILVEEFAENVLIDNCTTTNNREDGIFVGHPTNLPDKIFIKNCNSYLNGTDAGYGDASGIYVQQATRCTLENNTIGDSTSETTQERGIRTTSSSSELRVINNNVLDTNGGVAYSIGASTNYEILDEFRNNKADSGIVTPYGGANIIPYATTFDSSGNVIRQYRGLRTALSGDTTPTAGTWQAGDIIFYDVATAGGRLGTTCVASGSQGTWKLFGDVDS